jgi:putative glycosyltransferase (TIGR04348 family)
MLALHARRSHDSIRRYAASYPQRRLVVALTGTDIYRDIHVSSQARESLELAHRLITLQPRAAAELAAPLRRKVRVVVQSSATTLRHDPVAKQFRICVIGHLREEKDPLRIVAALSYLDDIQVIHLGAALDAALGSQALAAARRDSRYRWLGGVPHGRALAWLASSHALVISSRMEGGANVVSEALRIGVPVLASRISGNVGLLGSRYPAYFAPEDERDLAGLIHRAATDKRFYATLKRQVASLRPMVAPRAEARALLGALKSDSSGTES